MESGSGGLFPTPGAPNSPTHNRQAQERDRKHKFIPGSLHPICGVLYLVPDSLGGECAGGLIAAAALGFPAPWHEEVEDPEALWGGMAAPDGFDEYGDPFWLDATDAGARAA